MFSKLKQKTQEEKSLASATAKKARVRFNLADLVAMYIESKKYGTLQIQPRYSDCTNHVFPNNCSVNIHVYCTLAACTFL